MKLLVAVALWIGSWISTVHAEQEPLKVVASFSILGDMVIQTAGNLATVTSIVGPDSDAHMYQPSVGDAIAVAEADVVFVNGLGFETWSKSLIEASGSLAPVFVVSAGVEPIKIDGEVDPHAWNSLENGIQYVRNIATALNQVLPESADQIDAQASQYIKEIQALDEAARVRIDALDAERRTVVTAHDAFGYLAASYDLTFLAPLGIDTEAEPSARELASLITQLKSSGASALFVENITNPALIRQISEETGISIGGRLYSDALSEKGGPATSYISMFEHNLGALVGALEK